MGIMGARIGMLVVETIAKIRRAYLVQKKPIKAICRELNLSRKVVRKVIRSEATEFRYRRERQPQPKLGPWREHPYVALARPWTYRTLIFLIPRRGHSLRLLKAASRGGSAIPRRHNEYS
jgi:hypothetical protein